ncbi:hypothetical protein ACFY4I_26340 [Streptomyces scabiei]|uniref:hypothetical protein n=1 Tax=Streptomyces scabiei TaxID=1930 RepID=UPI0036C91B4D
MTHRESSPVLVLPGGNVHTVDPAVPYADEVAGRSNRIAWVGDAADTPEWVGNAMLAALNREVMNGH